MTGIKCIADFHIHSHYSRATSPRMNIADLAAAAKLKGVDVLGTGDFTHPLWLAELKQKLKPLGNGLFECNGAKFILSAEISSIYSLKGSRPPVKKIHHVLLAPSFEAVDQVNEALGKIGNLKADGRPILGLPSPDLVEIVMSVSPECEVIGAHIWTPWFSLFGSNSGFDHIQDCYDDQLKHIHALETGLSSDPLMNWRLSQLDKYALVSNSDSHSPEKIGREANIFSLPEVSYRELISAIRAKDSKRFLCTYEFFPEEGKYHVDGHRDCNVRLSPGEAKKLNNICPVCHRPLTIGVLHRVDDLADRPEGFVPRGAIPFEHIVPLSEILAQVLGKGEATSAVQEEYARLSRYFGNEFNALHASGEDLKLAGNEKVAQAITSVQAGRVQVLPGYDGVYGKVRIQGFGPKDKDEAEEGKPKPKASSGQKSLADY